MGKPIGPYNRISGCQHSVGRPLGRGFTLIEVVISMLIVGVMLSAAMHTVGGAAKANRVLISLQQGPALGYQLMSEVVSARYKEPDDTAVFGLETGEAGRTRARFDDVDDYDGWSSTPLKAVDGTEVANTQGWTRTVSVVYVQPTSPDTTSVSDTGLKRITVTVTDPQGKQVTCMALCSNTGVYEQVPVVDTTFVAQVGVQVQIGTDPRATVIGSTNLLDRPTSPNGITAIPIPTPTPTPVLIDTVQ